MRLVWLLPLVLAGCTEPFLPDGDLSVGGSATLFLPAASQEEDGGLRPSAKTYRIQIDRDGAFTISAVSNGLQERSRLRLILYDARGVVQAQSAARNWFGLPQVALASISPQGITTEPTDPGYRLNFRAQAGDLFYVRVENLAAAEDKVILSLESFRPNSSGRGEEFTNGTIEGAIEFLGEFDRYDVSKARGNPPSQELYLRFSYSGPLDLVALLYSSPQGQDPTPVRLDPVLNCAPVSPAVLLVVRDQSGARAGFDEPSSGQYTLTLSESCQ